MRISKLNKLLNLWEEKQLISSEQNKNISEFMKERQREQFFRFIKWFFIIGAFWLLFGFIATIIQFFDLSFMEKIRDFIVSAYIYLTEPIMSILRNIFGDNLGYFIGGSACFILSWVTFYINQKLKQRSDVDSLNLTETQKSILKNHLWVEVIFCILFSAGFILFNKLLVPPHADYYNYSTKILPLWHMLGAGAFITMAYKFAKVSYLLFGLYFVSLSVGMLSGYDYACYWIGASRPVVQALVGFILILIGYIAETKITDNDELKERFAQTYNWVGLLTFFIAMWIISFWGFDLSYYSHARASAGELWFANILFIASSIGAMYYGAKNEHKLFFNYGLTFLIIETYTLFCSRLWDKLPFATASLLFGVMLITTGKLLIKIYLKKQN